MLDNTILTVSVPATSANIGVGYDTLGLAFNLRAKITFRESPTLIIDGCPEQFRNDDNLVWTSYIRACEKLGEEPTPKHITIDSPIPLSGGLGSSSTCVIAGIAAAMTESHSGWDPERALDFACHFEGHPDNVAPAIYGGLTSSFVEGGHTICTRRLVARGLSFVAIAPPYTVNTEDARKVVPQEVSLETAVYQMGRTVAVTHALETGNGGLLAAACNDKSRIARSSSLITRSSSRWPNLLAHARLSFPDLAPPWLLSATPLSPHAPLPRMPSRSEATSGFRFLSQRFWAPSSLLTTVSNTTTLSTKFNAAVGSATRQRGFLARQAATTRVSHQERQWHVLLAKYDFAT